MNCMPAVGWGFLPHFVFHRWVVHQTYGSTTRRFHIVYNFHDYCSFTRAVIRTQHYISIVHDKVYHEPVPMSIRYSTSYTWSNYISPLSTGWSESSYPQEVLSSPLTWYRFMASYLATTICAIRSPLVMVKSVCPWLMRITLISPR
jgi:hypothetical protein